MLNLHQGNTLKDIKKFKLWLFGMLMSATWTAFRLFMLTYTSPLILGMHFLGKIRQKWLIDITPHFFSHFQACKVTKSYTWKRKFYKHVLHHDKPASLDSTNFQFLE